MSKTFASATAHPLTWPEGFPRTARRRTSQFKATLFQALDNVNESLRKFADNSGKRITEVVISSNYSLSDSKPKDSGVAVYFTWDGERTCIPVDQYLLVQDNLQAIHHCIDAERVKLRHGGLNLVKAAFRGYASLPPPERGINWRELLGCDEQCSLNFAKAKYMALLRECHPDKHATKDDEAKLEAHRKTVELTAAWALAEQYFKSL